MPNHSAPSSRPLWVRLAVHEGTKRRTAVIQLVAVAMPTIVGLLLMVAGTLGSDTENWKNTRLAIGVALVVVSISLTFWIWRAIRWVDRNGGW